MDAKLRQHEQPILETHEASILLVCVDNPKLPAAFGKSALSVATTGRGAIAKLRLMQFDLVMIGSRLPDMSIWELIASLRALWPWQKWALVGSDITEQQEVRARTLGVMGVFEGLPGRAVLLELVRSLRHRARNAVKQGT